jgi:hypothetical protein
MTNPTPFDTAGERIAAIIGGQIGAWLLRWVNDRALRIGIVTLKAHSTPVAPSSNRSSRWDLAPALPERYIFVMRVCWRRRLSRLGRVRKCSV